MLSRRRLTTLTRMAAANIWHLGRQSSTAKSPGALFIFAKLIGMIQLPEEAYGFHAFLRERSPRVICEIGTASGGHLFMLGRSLPTVSTLIGVDLRIRHRALLRLLAPARIDTHLIDGDSSSAPVVEAVRRAVGDKQLDVLFIDGDHSYSGVRRDYLNFRGLVRDDGIIAFHDIVPDHTSRFGRQTVGSTGGVPLFWSQLKSNGQAVEFVANPEQDGCGIGALVHSAGTAPQDL